jgi:hypothetical protein
MDTHKFLLVEPGFYLTKIAIAYPQISGAALGRQQARVPGCVGEAAAK